MGSFNRMFLVVQGSLVQQSTSSKRSFNRSISGFHCQGVLAQDTEMRLHTDLCFTSYLAVMQISTGLDLLDHTHFGHGSFS